MIILYIPGNIIIGHVINHYGNSYCSKLQGGCMGLSARTLDLLLTAINSDDSGCSILEF